MRYTTTDGPKKPLNAIQEGSLGDKMGIAVPSITLSRQMEICNNDKGLFHQERIST